MYAIMVSTPSLEAKDQVMDIVRRQFSPEFLNRIDEIILFNRLDRKGK